MDSLSGAASLSSDGARLPLSGEEGCFSADMMRAPLSGVEGLVSSGMMGLPFLSLRWQVSTYSKMKMDCKRSGSGGGGGLVGENEGNMRVRQPTFFVLLILGVLSTTAVKRTGNGSVLPTQVPMANSLLSSIRAALPAHRRADAFHTTFRPSWLHDRPGKSSKRINAWKGLSHVSSPSSPSRPSSPLQTRMAGDKVGDGGR